MRNAPQKVDRRKVEQLRAEIAQDIAAIEAYEKEHGSFPEMVRQHYRSHSED